MSKGWIGVDLDGTLAIYKKGWGGLGIIGEPIPAMVERVRRWLAEGIEVRIFTARVSHSSERPQATQAIIEWSEKHLGRRLPVVCCKDWDMVELWDDRAVRVETNTGRVVGYEEASR